MLTNRILRTAAALAGVAGIGLAGLLHCTRSNPIDPDSPDYIPNTPPDALFAADTVRCIAADSVQFVVSWSDTQSLGGGTPSVTALYFNWDGDSSAAAMTDSLAVSGNGPVTITRSFPTARDVAAYVRARDNDHTLGPAGSVRLIVTAGVLPEVNFLRDTVTGFTLDSIAIPVAWSDTQAFGAKTPDIEMLYFNWFGNSASLNDSIDVAALADSTTLYRIFWLILPNGKAYVRARDNDGQLSPLDSMWLVVDPGRPCIDSAWAGTDTVMLGDSVTFTAWAHDTNGAIRDFVWTVNGTDTTTAAGVLSVLFGAEGIETVAVRARDSDWIFSLPPDTLQVTVLDRTGPELVFWSHGDGDTVEQLSSTITLMVRTRDPSGILTLFINGAAATKFVDTTWPDWQTWQMNVSLTEGNNTLSSWVWDKSSGSNQTRDSITVFYRKPDNMPPLIVFSTPQPGDTLRDTLAPAPVTIRVSVTDPSGVAWVRCSDSAMTNTSGSNYDIDLMLGEGANALVITAQDIPGNGTADTLPVTYIVYRDSTPPDVRIASPSPMCQIAIDSVLTLVYASDTSGPIQSGMASVTVNGAAAVLNAGHYTASVPLVYGFNTLRAVAEDSSGNTAADSVIVIRNMPPVFVPNLPVKDTTVWLDSVSAIPVCASDPEAGPLTFGFVTWPVLDTGTPVITPSGGGCADIGYTPVTAGLDTFRVIVADSLLGTDTLKISVTVLEKPATKPYFTISTLPDTAILDLLYSVQLTAEDPQSLPLTYSLDYTVTPAAAAVDAVSGLLTWTPAGTADTTVAIRAIVSDTIPESDTLEWSVTVVLRNLPPVLAAVPDTDVCEGYNLQFTVSASDTNGDSLFYCFGGAVPLGASLDSATGAFAWIPGYRQAGVYPVVFRAVELFRNPALSDSMTVTITVLDTNLAPVILDPGNRTVAEECALTFTVRASDINGDSVVFTMSGAPAGAVLDRNSGLFTWVPADSEAGAYPVTFIATDNGVPPLADSAFDTISVIDTTIPVFDPYPAVDTILCGYPYIKVVHATDSTPDRMTYRKLIGPDSLVVNDSLGVVGWVPKTAGFQEIVPVSVTAEDHAGNKDTLSWLILVARWPRVYLSPVSNDTGFSVIQMPDGGYALSGTVADTAGAFSLGFFMRTDSSGNPTMPSVSYPGTEGHLSLYAMDQTLDGGFILCGTDVSVLNGTSKLVLIRTDPQGAPLWINYYSDMNGIFPSSAGASVRVTPDNGFIACGAAARTTIVPSEASLHAYAVKTDETGTVVEWDRVYTNGLRASAVYSVGVTEDGGFIMCGEIKSGTMSPTTDAYLVRTLPGVGDTLWTKVFDRLGNEAAFSVLPLSGTPEYLIAGCSMSGNVGAGMLMKVVEGGDTVWTRSLPVNTALASLQPTRSGDFIACGTGVASSGGTGVESGQDALLCRFTTGGAIEWLKFHGAALSDGGFCASATADGGFILTGYATTVVGGVTRDIYLAKTDANGDLEFTFGNLH